MTVLAANRWKTNGALIADVAALGYLNPADRVLDPTYGLGRWWTQWQPDNLTATDIDRAKSPDGSGVDFRHLPWADGHFDVVAFDPPYKLNGTPTYDVDSRYGVDTVASWQDRHQLIRDGITECNRALRVGGRLLLKCQDQVCSGKVRWQTIEFTNHAASIGLDLIDRFDLLGTSRPQPAGRRQVHAHGRPSTLLVFVKAARPPSE